MFILWGGLKFTSGLKPKNKVFSRYLHATTRRQENDESVEHYLKFTENIM